MVTPAERLSTITLKLSSVKQNILQLEEWLTSTTGPADDLIAEVKMLKEVQDFYTTQYDIALKEYNNDSS